MLNYHDYIVMSSNPLQYYMFDWDDNVLIMPTVIHLEKHLDGGWERVDVSTKDFAKIRHVIGNTKDDETLKWRYPNNDPEQAFCEFRDTGPRGSSAFIEDTKAAVGEGAFGPVWSTFIKCLIEGHGFLVITARGHEPSTLRSAVEWIIYNYLSTSDRKYMVNQLHEWNKLFDISDHGWSSARMIEEYLDFCSFVGIYSAWFEKTFRTKGESGSPEEYKVMAIEHYLQKVSKFGETLGRKISVGFSDDDPATISTIYKKVKDDLAGAFPFDFNIYSTNGGSVKKLSF